MDSHVYWKPLPSPIHQRVDGASTVVRSTDGEPVGVVLVGGRDPKTGDAISAAEFFEWNLQEWWSLPLLCGKRAHCAVSNLMNKVFVVGGVDGEGQVLDTVEFWTLSCNASSWQTVPLPMSTPRWGCATVGMSRQGLLVVIGGRNAEWQSLTSVEAYSIEQRRWKAFQSLATPRFGCTAVAIGPSRIMIMGGYDGTNFLSSCRVYDMEEDEWTDLPSMPLPCAFASATVIMRDSRFVLVIGHTMCEADVPIASDNHNRNDSEAYSFASATSKVIQCYCVKYRKWKVLTTSQVIENGNLMSIGENLIAIGAPPNPSFGDAKERTGGTTRQVCRQYRLINLNLGDNDDTPSVDNTGRSCTQDWRHRSHYSAGDASALSSAPSVASPTGSDGLNRAMVRANTMPYLPTALNTNFHGQVALGALGSFRTTSVTSTGSSVYFPSDTIL